MVREDLRITIGPPILTRYERARILGARALQISMGAPLLLDIDPDEEESDPLRLAVMELDAGILPISVRRKLPNGSYQDIPLKWLLEQAK